jgi:hypothetical protein
MPPHVLAFSTVDAVSAMVTFEQGTAPAQLEKGWRRLPGCRCINFSSVHARLAASTYRLYLTRNHSICSQAMAITACNPCIGKGLRVLDMILPSFSTNRIRSLVDGEHESQRPHIFDIDFDESLVLFCGMWHGTTQ